MIASDWVVGISVVVGEQGPLVRGAGLPVPPDRGGQGQQPLGDTDGDAGPGSSPGAFQPELVFEGVEGALDPLAPATQRAQPVGLVGTVGAQQGRAVGGDQLLELPAGEPLVAQDEQSWPQPGALVVQHGGDHLALAQPGTWQATGRPQCVTGRSRGRSWSSMAATTSRSPSLGLARHQATGRPSGVASTYRRKPQK